MTSFRWTVLFGVMIAGLVGLTIYDTKRAERQEKIEAEAAKLMKLPVDQISRIGVSRGEPKVLLEKIDGAWRVVAPIQDSADQEEVGAFLNSLQAESTLELVVEGDQVNLRTFGLDEPMGQIVLSTAKGETQTIQIGGVRAYDTNLYARLDGEMKVYLVSASWDGYLNKEARNFRDKRLFRSGAASTGTASTGAASGASDAANDRLKSVARIEIKQSEAGWPARLVLEKTSRDGSAPPADADAHADEWRLVGDSFPVDSSRVQAFLEQVRVAQGNGFRAVEKSERQALRRNGLDTPAVSIALFDDRSREIYRLLLSKVDKESVQVAATSSDISSIMTMSVASADTLRKRPGDFLDRKVPFQFPVAEVERIKIESPQITGEFKKAGSRWEAVDAEKNKNVDLDVVADLPGKIAKLEAVRVLDIAKGPSARMRRQGRIQLMNAAGESVFEMAWTGLTTEKEQADRPEARYHKVKTSAAARFVGVPEGSLQGLGLERMHQTQTAKHAGDETAAPQTPP